MGCRYCTICDKGIDSGYICGPECWEQLQLSGHGNKVRPWPVVSKAGQVYLVYSPELIGRIKIGWSTNVSNRLCELKVGSPLELRLLFSFPGGRDLEAYLHGVFSSRRLHGEWFDFPEGNSAAISLVSGAINEYEKTEEEVE